MRKRYQIKEWTPKEKIENYVESLALYLRDELGISGKEQFQRIQDTVGDATQAGNDFMASLQ